MSLVGDERGQAIQIGAVLLFGVLIISFSTYQAFVVPDQNRGIEFSHNQEVQSQMQDLRNAVVSVGGIRGSQAVSVQLGTRYPSRVIARNPGPPSGSLRTVGTTEPAVNLRIANAQATGETGDFWDEDQTYNTGVVRYTPSYNLYTNPPETVYENTVLYNRFPSGDLTLANQTFIDGTEISLVLLNGTLSETSTRSATVDVRAESSSTQTVTLDDDGSPITITFASTRSADYWTFLENTQSSVTDVRPAGSVNGLSLVTVELDDSQSYQVQLTKVGVGTGVTDEDTAYLTDISGDGRPVSQGESIALTLEVRDRFNNPPDNATTMQVTAEVAGSGSLQSTTQTPDEDGQVTFVYEATGTTGDQEIRFSYVGIDGDFDASTPQDVSMTVDVTSGSGGGYDLNWQNPSSDNPSAALSDCSASDCTWDVGASSDETLTLRAGTAPALEGFDVEFAGTDSSVGTVSPDEAATGSAGEVTTELTANTNGVVDVFAASGGSSDSISITVENTGSTAFSSTDITSVVPDSDDQRQTISFTLGSALSSTESVDITLTPAQGPDRVDYASAGVSLQSGTAASNLGFSTQSTTDAVINYSPQSDLSAGDTVVLRVTSIAVGPTSKQSNPYSISFTRTDSGSTTNTFSAAYDDGTSALSSVSATNLRQGGGQTQTISFTLDSKGLDTDDRVTIDLSDPQGPSAPNVDYTNANPSVTQGSGSISLNTQNTENATLQYSAGASDAAGDTVSVELTGVAANNGGTGTETYTVGFSREDADTASTTFEAQTAASQVSPNNDASIFNNNNEVQFSINNGGTFTATVTDIEVQSGTSNADILREEDDTGTGAGQREIYLSSSSDSGYYEAGDNGNPEYTIGSQQQLDSSASVGSGSDLAVTLSRFRTAGGGSSGSAVDMRGETFNVIFTFSDGSTASVEVNVPS
jgi:hypothetical protein